MRPLPISPITGLGVPEQALGLRDMRTHLGPGIGPEASPGFPLQLSSCSSNPAWPDMLAGSSTSPADTPAWPAVSSSGSVPGSGVLFIFSLFSYEESFLSRPRSNAGPPHTTWPTCSGSPSPQPSSAGPLGLDSACCLMFRHWAAVRHSGLLYSHLWQNKACFCQGLAFLGLSMSPSLEPGLRRIRSQILMSLTSHLAGLCLPTGLPHRAPTPLSTPGEPGAFQGNPGLSFTDSSNKGW